MKNVQQKRKETNPHFNVNKHRPENKDDLDSREGEEQLFKGDDTTHNKKEKKSSKTSYSK